MSWLGREAKMIHEAETLLEDEHGVMEHEYRTCRYCGHKKLVWKETHAGWRLFDPALEQLHFCHKYRA